MHWALDYLQNWNFLKVFFFFLKLFLKLFLFLGSRTPSQNFYFIYNIWQDAGNRTRKCRESNPKVTPNGKFSSIETFWTEHTEYFFVWNLCMKPQNIILLLCGTPYKLIISLESQILLKSETFWIESQILLKSETVST